VLGFGAAIVQILMLDIVFSIYDSEATHEENIFELVNEFIDWCRPQGGVRRIDALRDEWERFLEKRSA